MSIPDFLRGIKDYLDKFRNEPTLRKIVVDFDEKCLQYSRVDTAAFNITRTKNHTNSHELHKIINEKKEGNIIIFVENANNYILFDNVDELQSFLIKAEDSELAKYQIVFNNERQKLIFVYRDVIEEESIQKLSNYISECLGKKPIVTYDKSKQQCEILLDIMLDKSTENENYFGKLYDFVIKKDRKLALKLGLHHSLIEPQTGVKYTQHYIPDDITAMEKLVENLAGKHIKHLTIHIDQLINMNNVIGANNITVNNSSKKVDKTELTLTWINDNLPTEATPTMIYFQKYCEYMNWIKVKYLPIYKFDYVVEILGYNKAPINNIVYWVKD